MPAANWTNAQVLAQLNSGLKWNTSTITYNFPTSTAGLTGGSESSGFTAFNANQQAKAIVAIGLWDDLISNTLVRTTQSSSDIEFGNSSVGVDYAQAYFPSGGTVWFNPNYADIRNPVIGEYGFGTLIHELGHTFGLDHMGNYNGSGIWTPSSFQDSTVLSIMSYFGPNIGDGNGQVMWADWVAADGRLYSPQTPMMNDIMAMQAIYGADTNTRNTDTVYGFNSTLGSTSGGIYNFSTNLNPIICIYDAGGNDTLDLSGWSTSSTINLVPGTFCSGNSMTNNISISYTTLIENAVGGAGNDTILGNAYNNTLKGGGGDDTLTGGMGNDTIVGGTGTDTAIFSGAFSTYTVSYNANTQTFTVANQADGIDSVTGVENFQFSDVTKAAAQLEAGSNSTPSNPQVSVYAVTASANEGNSGTTDYSFTISLNSAASTQQTVSYNVAGNGASAANSLDFSGALSGSVVFAAGELSKTIHVLVAGDTVIESNETFGVVLSNASAGLTLGTASATATILNDDNPVVFNLIDGTRRGDNIVGTSGADYINGRGGDDTIRGGQGNDTIIGGDGSDRAIFSGAFSGYAVSYDRNTQTYTVTGGTDGTDTITGVEFFQFSDVTKTAAQLENGTAPLPPTSTVSISTITTSAAEGNSGATDYSFAINLNAASSTQQTVVYTVAGNGVNAANTGDFSGVLTGNVIFAAGETSKIIHVLVNGDTTFESNETFGVTLSNASAGLTLGTSIANAIILNDDVSSTPTTSIVSISAATSSASEGNSGTTDYSFTVNLNTSSSTQQTLTYSAAGSGSNAANAADFSGALTGNIVFAAGETSKTIHVFVAGDTIVETNETFNVTLSNMSSGLTLGTATASATILNDDANVVFNIIDGTRRGDNIVGTSGADNINGRGGDDFINGGLGNDILTGGTGNDTFSFTQLHFGNDVITDFEDRFDMIQINSNIATNLNEFIITGNDTNTVVVSHGEDSITITGLQPIHLSASDFMFV